MEIKWLMIGFAVMISSISVDHAISSHSQNQCKQVYAASNRSAEDILKICK